eukprot:352026-Chlamydomonas_euryale.AAC.2
MHARDGDLNTFSHAWSVPRGVHAAGYNMQGENNCSTPSPAPRRARAFKSFENISKRTVLCVWVTHVHAWFRSSGVF